MVWIVIVVSLTAGHFMFILKNSSSLYPRAVLRGPWFKQSASGCTMTFWWESHCSLASSVFSFNFFPFLLSQPCSLSIFFISQTQREVTHLNLPCFDSFMAPESLCQTTDFIFPLGDWRGSPGRKVLEVYTFHFFYRVIKSLHVLRLASICIVTRGIWFTASAVEEIILKGVIPQNAHIAELEYYCR